jgi:hypothetical protein
MTLRKRILLFIGLAMVAALVACSSSSSSSTPPPLTIAISATGGASQSATVGTGFPTALQVTVTSNGAPANGVTVTFAAPSSGASCTLANTTVTTNSSGIASTTCTANTIAGPYIVTASATAATAPADFSLTNTAATAAISVNGGNNQNATVGTAFGTALSVLVTSNGSPDANASVTFTVVAGSSGASGSFAIGGTVDSETTNSQGIATTSQTLTANSTAGTYTVSAMTTGASTPATFTLTNNPGPAADLVLSSGNNQSAVVSTTYASLVAQVTDSDGNGVSGVNIQFTVVPGGTSAGGTFTGGASTETVSSDTNGNATVSDLTANSTVGAFTVTAAPTTATLTPPSVTFNETNVPVPPLAAGNYVFFVSGTDSGAAGNGPSPYALAGAFATNNLGQITGGLQDFSDFSYNVAAEAITGGSVAASTTPGDTNITITINTGDTNIGPGATTLGGGSGTLVLDVSMASATRGLAIEYDTWASSKGELDLQTSTGPLCPSASSSTPCSYAFGLGGVDAFGLGLGVGGVIEVDSVGGISGNGSVFDINDFCGDYNGSTCSGASFPDNALTASTVGSPSTNPYGFVTFSLNSGLFASSPGILLDGYIVDANHVFLVENWLNLSTGDCNDALCSTTGGLALAQTGTGSFATSSISGSNYVVSMFGSDDNGPLQSAGVLAFSSSSSSLGGDLSYNDITVQNAQGGEAITGGTYHVDGPGSGNTDSGTGRVTLTGVTDTGADFLYDLELYLTGDGHALVISMDAGNTSSAPDVLGGLSWQQASGLTVGSFSGNYAYAGDGFVSGDEVDEVGVVNSNGSSTVSGFADENGTIAGAGLTPDTSLSATYGPGTNGGSGVNGVFDVTSSGGSATPFTAYLVDDTQGVIIENDNVELLLGYFANQ